MAITDKIINYIAFKVSQMEDNGLYHGKMGVILALYCHGKVHQDKRISDFACDILQLSDGDYHLGNIGLEKGMAGIGLGFCLLYKAGMYDDDLNDILTEVDRQIMAVDPRRLTDFSFKSGALGILHYINIRRSVQQECETLELGYIKELEQNIYVHASLDMARQNLLADLTIPNWKPNEYLDEVIGIDNGSSYFLIRDNYDKVFPCK